MNRSKRGHSSIKEITKGVLRKISKESERKQGRIRRAWIKAAGKKCERHTQPTSLRKKRLTVSVDSSGWLYDLTLRKREITARLKKELKNDFKEVRFRIGEIDKEERE
jgi:predicted nucleic acid-binding Zn ribbon protein